MLKSASAKLCLCAAPATAAAGYWCWLPCPAAALVILLPWLLHGPQAAALGGLAYAVTQSIVLSATFAVSHNVPESKPLDAGQTQVGSSTDHAMHLQLLIIYPASMTSFLGCLLACLLEALHKHKL